MSILKNKINLVYFLKIKSKYLKYKDESYKQITNGNNIFICIKLFN